MRAARGANRGRAQEAEREIDSEELIWGIHPVSALLQQRPRQVLALFVAPGRADQRIGKILDLARHHGIVVHHDQALPLAESSSRSHQGVAARIKPLPLLSLNELLPLLKAQDAPPLTLALDSIQDPQNLGAIIRCAAAFGVKALLLPKDRSASLTGTVMKAAAGTVGLLDICQVTNLAEALNRLKEYGFWIYGAAGDAPQSLDDAQFSGPICLVLGNEQKGLRPLIRRCCDQLIAIPLAAGVESLNVAVATGVILAAITRQTKQLTKHPATTGHPAPGLL